MRLIIDCPPQHFEAAMDLARKEMADYGKYTKVGWGWSFGNYRTGPRFFVRRLGDGLSVREIKP